MGRVKKAVAGVFLIMLISISFSQISMAANVKQPKGLKVKDYDKNYITLSWSKVSKAKGYIVYQYNPYSKKYTRIKATSKLSYTMYGRDSGTTYRFKIKAFRVVKGKTYYSKFSKNVKVKTKPDPTSQVSTIKKFLKTALKPVGKTVYVWGGGWSTDGLCGSTEGRSIGVAKRWVKFYNKQTKQYNFENTRFQRHDGLDCSGYVGWCIYNIMNKKSGNNGYVMYAQTMAKNYAAKGWGKYIKKSKVKTYKPGDIMSSNCSCCGHVWIVIGQCEDGSVVTLHSTANGGVQLSGTVTPKGKKKSQAVKLAKKYMQQYYPDWCKKFNPMTKGSSYLEHYCQMRWDVTGTTIMTDPEGYQDKTPQEVLNELIGPIR